MNDDVLTNWLGAIRTMSHDQRQKILSALNDPSALNESDELSLHNNKDESQEIPKFSIISSPFIDPWSVEETIKEEESKFHQHTFNLWNFICKRVVSIVPDELSGCEWCGRKTNKPFGCNNAGTKKSLDCTYAHT